MMFNAKAEVKAWLQAEADGHRLYPYSRPDQALRFTCSDEMIRRVTSSGSFYFARDTMQVWKTRVFELVSDRFLIVSDRGSDGRIYRVAYATQPTDSHMISMERSSHMASLLQARAFARELCRVVDAPVAAG